MTQRGDVAGLQRVLADYDPLDQQLQDPLALGECRLAQTQADPPANRLKVGPHRSGRLLFVPEALFLVSLGDQHLPASADLLAAGLLLGQADHLGLMRIDQSLLFAGESLELRFSAMHRGRTALVGFCEPSQLLNSTGQRRRLLQEGSDMIPHGRVEFLDLGRGLCAAAGSTRATVSLPWHL